MPGVDGGCKGSPGGPPPRRGARRDARGGSWRACGARHAGAGRGRGVQLGQARPGQGGLPRVHTRTHKLQLPHTHTHAHTPVHTPPPPTTLHAAPSPHTASPVVAPRLPPSHRVFPPPTRPVAAALCAPPTTTYTPQHAPLSTSHVRQAIPATSRWPWSMWPSGWKASCWFTKSISTSNMRRKFNPRTPPAQGVGWGGGDGRWEGRGEAAGVRSCVCANRLCDRPNFPMCIATFPHETQTMLHATAYVSFRL